MPNQSSSPSGGRPPYSLVFLAAALAVLILTFRFFAPILLSLLLVLLFASALNPLVSWLRDRLTGGRAVATLLLVFFLLGLFGAAGWAVFRPVNQTISVLVVKLPEYWQRIQRPLMRLEQKAAISETKAKEEIAEEIAEDEIAQTGEPPPAAAVDESQNDTNGILRTALSQLLSGVAGGFSALASNVASLAIVIGTVAFGVMFMLMNPRPVFRFFFKWVPEQHHDRALRIVQRIMVMVPRWAMATLLGMFVVGLLVFFTMWPILGFQDALLLALIAFVFEAVPYIGPILAFVPALLLAMNQGGLSPLWVLLAYAGIQVLENNLIVPVIVGGRLSQHPLAVLFAVLLSLTVFGIFGVFLAVPAVAVFNILHEELYQRRFLPGVSAKDLERLAEQAMKPPAALKKMAPD
jgi:predicted PurR-regulated permease PerM